MDAVALESAFDLKEWMNGSIILAPANGFVYGSGGCTFRQLPPRALRALRISSRVLYAIITLNAFDES